MNTIQQLWHDQRGAVLSTELILVATIVILGLLVGMTVYRNAVVQELGDTAAAAASLNQSYSYDAVTLSGSFGVVAYDASVDGSDFEDETDAGQPAVMDPANDAPMGISLIEPATPE